MSAGTDQPSGGVGVEDGTELTVGRRAFVGGTIAAATTAGATGAGRTVSAQGELYGGWFEDVDTYEGTVDYRGRDEVTVAVGAGDDGLLFDPPAILVDPGTTVAWEWTGEGGGHNVVHEPSEGSERTFQTDVQSGNDATFEYTFDEVTEGIYRYYCDPHRALGMKGAVAVGSVDDQLLEPGGGEEGGADRGSLTTADQVLAAVGVLVAIGLILVVVRPGSIDPERT